MAFTYRVLTLGNFDTPKVLQEKLEKYGSGNWELVTSVGMVLIFKKRYTIKRGKKCSKRSKEHSVKNPGI